MAQLEINTLRMRPFQFLDQRSLLDMLAYTTARYTKLFANATEPDDFFACRELIRLIQIEILVRKEQKRSPDSNELKANQAYAE